MKILIAMDSFKESLSSLEAAQAAERGFRRVCPEAEISLIPVADGGEGTTEALIYGAGGKPEQVRVLDLLGRTRCCHYGILPDGTAVIEAAAAAGLQLLRAQERDPLHTTSYGLGQMIAAAIKKGCRNFVIGLGGSGTNDGGIGMLQALGFGMLNCEGVQVPYGAEGMSKIHCIDTSGAIPELSECKFEIACDVNNPLCGENGASAVYGPQKGADSALILQMDAWMAQYAEKVKSVLPCSDPAFPGAGAAGGLGFAMMSFLHGTMHRGIDLVIEHSGLRDKIRTVDLVVTGEGCIDGQTSTGKTPWGIAAAAKELDKPVIALCGSLRNAEEIHEKIDACFSIVSEPCSLDVALNPTVAANNLANTAEQVLRMIKAVQK